MLGGYPPPSKRRKFREAMSEFCDLKDSVGNDESNQPQSMLEFLKVVGHNFQMDA